MEVIFTSTFFVNFSFLWVNERQWLLNVHKLELINARKFYKAFRFIDDEDIIICCFEFEQ